MRNLFLISMTTLCLFACQTIPEGPGAPPKTEPEEISVADAKKAIFDLIATDDCSKESYAEKGKAPGSYHKGISLTAAQVFCAPDSDTFKIASQPLGSTSADAIAYYGLKPQSVEEMIATTLAMMIGSNARESDWRPFVGRDTVAKASDIAGCLYDGVKYFGSGSTCEAGLPQTSFNSVPKSGPLRDLFNDFKSYPKGCFRAEYYGKMVGDAANLKNHGSDPQAVLFQKMSKECPGYTVQAGLQMFRTKRSHYGPINTKKALVKKSCVARFQKIAELVKAKPAICKAL